MIGRLSDLLLLYVVVGLCYIFPFFLLSIVIWMIRSPWAVQLDFRCLDLGLAFAFTRNELKWCFSCWFHAVFSFGTRVTLWKHPNGTCNAERLYWRTIRFFLSVGIPVSFKLGGIKAPATRQEWVGWGFEVVGVVAWVFRSPTSFPYFLVIFYMLVWWTVDCLGSRQQGRWCTFH